MNSDLGDTIEESEVTIIAQIRAKAGREDDVFRELAALVPLTRTEDGCLCYILHRDHNDHAQFCFYERWRSRQDLDEHLAMPYLQAFISKADELLDGPLNITALDVLV